MDSALEQIIRRSNSKVLNFSTLDLFGNRVLTNEDVPGLYIMNRGGSRLNSLSAWLLCLFIGVLMPLATPAGGAFFCDFLFFLFFLFFQNKRWPQSFKGFYGAALPRYLNTKSEAFCTYGTSGSISRLFHVCKWFRLEQVVRSQGCFMSASGFAWNKWFDLKAVSCLQVVSPFMAIIFGKGYFAC